MYENNFKHFHGSGKYNFGNVSKTALMSMLIIFLYYKLNNQAET